MLIEVPPIHDTGKGAGRVLTMSSIAFTLMFAVWLMFGILGVPIQKELALTDEQLSWISALAVLNGSMWRLPAGILTDPHWWPQDHHCSALPHRHPSIPGFPGQ